MVLEASDLTNVLIACAIVGPIIILAIIATIIALKKRLKYNKKSNNEPEIVTNNEFELAFGENNIVSKTLEMSRITVEVRDIEKVNTDKLKELGANGVLLVGNKVKCSFENSEEIYNNMKGE